MALSARAVMDNAGFTPRLAGIMDPSATRMFLYPIT